jgi:dsDNA-specific endonuclease/ATPase MutS2
MAPAAWLLLVTFVALLVAAWWSQRRGRAAPRSNDSRAADEQAADADEPGVIAIEDAIDLHGFAPRDIPSVVEAYLEAAAERGLSEVRLIHGRGKGVQRRRVQEILAAHPLVERYADAPAYRGGWGATIAWLRPAPADDQPRPPV